MSNKEMRFQVAPKTFRLYSWITQRIRQWVPNRRTGNFILTSIISSALQFKLMQQRSNTIVKLLQLSIKLKEIKHAGTPHNRDRFKIAGRNRSSPFSK